MGVRGIYGTARLREKGVSGGGGGGCYWDDEMLMLMCVDFYRPPKNLRKLTTRELPLVTLGEGVEGRPCAGRAMMILASSSYCAWDSRGSWPNRPKAHGAAVDVGNRENEEEDDILFDGLCGRDDGCRYW